MNKVFYITTFYLITSYSFAQHTDKFNDLAAQVEVTDTIHTEKKYPSGQLKNKGTELQYKYGKYLYTFSTGQHTDYFSNGQVYFEAEYDAFGLELSKKIYDEYGNLQSESETTKIDTEADNIEEFLSDKKYYIITSHNKQYEYSANLGKWYLKSEGKMLNKKKFGSWVSYDEYGAKIKP